MNPTAGICIDGQNVGIDRVADFSRTNNADIIGSTGSGKTSLVKQELVSILQTTKDEVVILVGSKETANEYAALIEQFEGELWCGDDIMQFSRFHKRLTVFCFSDSAQWTTIYENASHTVTEERWNITFVLQAIEAKMNDRFQNADATALYLFLEDDIGCTKRQLERIEKIRRAARINYLVVTRMYSAYPKEDDAQFYSSMMRHTRYVFALSPTDSNARILLQRCGVPDEKMSDGILPSFLIDLEDGFSPNRDGIILEGKKIVFGRNIEEN